MNIKSFIVPIIFSIFLSSCCTGFKHSLISDIGSEKYRKYNDVDTSLCIPKPFYKKMLYVPLRSMQWISYGVGVGSLGIAAIAVTTDDDDDQNYDTDNENYLEKVEPLKLIGIGASSLLVGAMFDYFANSLLTTSSSIKRYHHKYKPEKENQKEKLDNINYQKLQPK